MKYMVMECHLSYAVVLDEEGHFLTVANMHYKVGQTVTEVVELKAPQTSPEKKKVSKWMYSLAAMAACLILVVISISQIGRMTYASVYLSINPEVRIDVNREDTVVDLEGINLDGKALIENYSYKKKPLDLVMDELVDKAIDMGYLYEGGQISLVLDAKNDQWVVTHSSSLPAHLNEHLDEKLSVTIEITDKNTQSNQVFIPIVPEENNYSEHDYTEDTSSLQAPEDTAPTIDDYDSNQDDGQTDYGTQAIPDNSQTGYENNTDISSQLDNIGTENYGGGENSPSNTSNLNNGNDDINGSQTDYENDEDYNDSQTDYEIDEDYNDNDGQIDYEIDEDYNDNDSQTDYEIDKDYNDNDSQTDYDFEASEDAQSDYDTDDENDSDEWED